MTEEMQELVERIEAATGPNYRLDVDIWSIVGPAPLTPVPAYTASIDAAMTLVPAKGYWSWGGLSGIARVLLFTDGDADTIETHGSHRLPALALCAAALRARATP